MRPPGGMATPGRHRTVLRALAIVLLVSSAVVLGANLYFHILGFLGGTAHSSAMFGLALSTLAVIRLLQSVQRSFSKLEGAAGFEVPRALCWARGVVGAYALIVLLHCWFTNDSFEGKIVPSRWLVAIPALPMLIAFHALTVAVCVLLLRGRERGMTCPSSSPPTPA